MLLAGGFGGMSTCDLSDIKRTMSSFWGVLRTAVQLLRNELLPWDHHRYHTDRLRLHLYRLKCSLSEYAYRAAAAAVDTQKQLILRTIERFLKTLRKIEEMIDAVVINISGDSTWITQRLPKQLGEAQESIAAQLA
jgi:hypothetical protein